MPSNPHLSIIALSYMGQNEIKVNRENNSRTSSHSAPALFFSFEIENDGS
jgi:hypothetical protein